MEMVDNPLPVYSNDDDNRNTGKSGNIRKTRIQSFTEKSGLIEGSSGLTLGLILKEYCEFQVINKMLTIIIIMLLLLGININDI